MSFSIGQLLGFQDQFSGLFPKIQNGSTGLALRIIRWSMFLKNVLHLRFKFPGEVRLIRNGPGLVDLLIQRLDHRIRILTDGTGYLLFFHFLKEFLAFVSICLNRSFPCLKTPRTLSDVTAKARAVFSLNFLIAPSFNMDISNNPFSGTDMAGEPAPVFAAIPMAGRTGGERLSHRMSPSATTGRTGRSGTKLCFPCSLAVTTADNRFRQYMRASAAAAWTGCAS